MNNSKIRPNRPLSFLLILLVGFFVFSPQAEARKGKKIPFQLQQEGPPKKVSPQDFCRQVEGLLVQGTNRERNKKGLGSLSVNSILVKAGIDHSRDMLRRNYLSHFSPEGKSVLDRVSKYVPKIQTHIGENVHTMQSSRGLWDAKAVSDLMMKDWMHSPSHRKNLLSDKFTQIGVGCVGNGTTIYCTQVFSGPNL